MEHVELMISRYPSLCVCEGDVRGAFEVLRAAFESGHKLLVCGNGGSSADAQHIVGELMKGFCKERRVEECESFKKHMPDEDAEYMNAHLQGALPAHSLFGETALITAFINDVAPDMIYAQQVYGYGEAGDVLLGISTSGNAANVYRAAQIAKAKGLKVIGLTGQGGGKLKNYCDVCICVPETETYQVQELHLPVYHTLCLMLEDAFFGGTGYV